MPRTKETTREIVYLSTAEAAELLATLDPAEAWTFRKLKDRIDRKGIIVPQVVGKANVFTRRQLERYVALQYREWPAPYVGERAYSSAEATAALSQWLDETISERQMEYLVTVKQRLHPQKVGRTLVYSHRELRRFLKAERSRRRGKLLDDDLLESA